MFFSIKCYSDLLYGLKLFPSVFTFSFCLQCYHIFELSMFNSYEVNLFFFSLLCKLVLRSLISKINSVIPSFFIFFMIFIFYSMSFIVYGLIHHLDCPKPCGGT